MSRKIAFFDFDGTITTKDTLLEMIRHSAGPAKFTFGFLLNSPFIVMYKAGIISNQSAKEKVLRFFFGKQSVEQFNALCAAYASTGILQVLRRKALHEIALLKEKGVEICIVSASPENWLKPWCDANGLHLLATRMQQRNGKITGKIEGANCHGEEKVRRIRGSFDLSQYDQILCYGDTKGDKPMLELATCAYYRPFR